jgi:hypothetical protein
MESEGVSSIQAILDANRSMWIASNIIFWGGGILLSIYIRKINSFTLIETLLASVGLKKYKRNWKMNLGHFLLIAVPLGLMTYAITSQHAI